MPECRKVEKSKAEMRNGVLERWRQTGAQKAAEQARKKTLKEQKKKSTDGRRARLRSNGQRAKATARGWLVEKPKAKNADGVSGGVVEVGGWVLTNRRYAHVAPSVFVQRPTNRPLKRGKPCGTRLLPEYAFAHGLG